MIERVIHFSIKNKFIVGLFILALTGWGTWSLLHLPIDAIPDITNNQVQVISMAPSLATQEVESIITAPIEMAVANIPDIIELRSISRLGLSVVTVVFKDGVDIYWARQQLGERLKEAEEIIPAGLAKIELAPVSTGLGEIYQYRLVAGKGYNHTFNPMALRTIQDWIVRREMLGTPGVADINSYGGFVKQYEIAVNPERLKGMNLSLTDIFDALESNNENTGSAYIDKKPTAYFIRGIGLVRSIGDIEKIVVKSNPSGIPILIRDIATVGFGSATRYGAFVIDTTEAVGGVVMMLKGANAHEVIDNVETRIRAIQKSLPTGVTIEPYLNRSDLVGRAIGTVSRNLVEGALIVIFILVLLLGNLRAGLIVASVIPLSMLFAISLMNIFGVSGNLMSLGAIDFGLIVDGAVIIVESAIYRLFLGKNNTDSPILSQQEMDGMVLESTKRMMGSATFGQIIILIVYLPIMALVGIEGKMFRPMAQVVTFALLGAAILSLTYVPVASALFLSKKRNHQRNISDRIMEGFQRAFQPVISFALNRKGTVTMLTIILFLFSLFLFSRLGGEFIPELEEGDLAAGVMTLQGGSLSHTVETVEKANKILIDNFPEVKHAVCKIGAAEIPTDPTPMETGDYIITLKDKSEWTSATTRAELITKMEEKLVTLAGVKFEFQQPIQMRFNELMTGAKQDVAIKIFGDNLDLLAEKAGDVEKLILNIPGVVDINVEKVTGLAQVQIEFDRDRLAQYGLSVKEVNRVLKAAFAGSQAGVVYEEEKRFALVVRLEKDYRNNIEDVRSLSVVLPNGGQIPMEQLATIEIKSGPAQVSREDTKRRITIGFNVRNRDIQSVIAEVTRLIDQEIELPAGYYVTYGGQFQNFEAAKARLLVAVPVALLLIFVLLYFTFHSVKQTLLILSAVPLAAIGGVFALWIRGMNFSISAGVGFIALFGVAVLNGIVLIAEFNRLEKAGFTDITERVLKGLRTRLRPVIITAAVASLGFLPMALSNSAGAEVQKPLATVVIGGLISATFLTLIVLPVFYIAISKLNFRFSNMMKTRKNLILTMLPFGLLLMTGQGQAQEPVTVSLKEAIQMALDSNLAIRSSVYSVDFQKALKGASVDIPKTAIDGQTGQFNSSANDNSLTISQSFAFPTVYLFQNKLSKAGIKSADWQLLTSRLEVATRVKQVYGQLVYLQTMRKLVAYQDSLLTGFLRAAELRFKSGETNRLEMISAKSQSMEVKNQLQLLESDLTIHQNKLRTLLNSRLTLVPAEETLQRKNFSDTGNFSAWTGNPSLGYLQQQVEVSHFERKVESSKMLPDLSVGYFNQSIQGTEEIDGLPRTFGPGDRFEGVQAGVTIPLWFRPYTSRIKAAKIREVMAQNNADYFSKSVENEYQNLLSEYAKYSMSLDYYEKQALTEANLIIDQATRSYKAGAMDYLDYIMSLNRAITIRQNYLDALNNFNQTIISLEFITGKVF